MCFLFGKYNNFFNHNNFYIKKVSFEIDLTILIFFNKRFVLDIFIIFAV